MSGYNNCKFVHPLPSGLQCTYCGLVLRNPVQTACGHRFCKACVDELLEQQTPSCPMDNCKEPITQSELHRDRGCQKEILNLDVKCGCEWVGKVKEVDAHNVDCDYSEVQCKWCGDHVQERALASHQMSDCPMRPEQCAHCSQAIPFQQMQAHLANVCPEVIRSFTNRPELQMGLDQVMRAREIQNLREQMSASAQRISELEKETYHVGMDHWPDGREVCLSGRKKSTHDSFFGSRSSLQSDVAESEHSLESCLDLDLRIQLNEHATYNGIFIWKINDFAHRRREAVNGVTQSLYSSPFYTSQHGYKMCIRLYLNGDGLSKGTHMSLFFHLMNPSIGPLLAQPMKCKVLFSLLTGMEERNIKFLHKIYLEIVQRETLSCGSCLFPLKQVHECVVNDTLTICAQLSPTEEYIEASNIEEEEEEISDIGRLTFEVESLREHALGQQQLSMAYEQELKKL